jgi:hypothetical protein
LPFTGALSGCHDLCTPQLRASRPRIIRLLCFARLNDVSGEHAQRARTLAFLKCVLYEAIFA